MTAPALPTFTDGTVVHQADLNALVSNINVLATNTAGKQQAAQYLRPFTLLRLTSTQNITNNTVSLVNWGVADLNTDSMWTGSTPNQLTAQTAGVYMITFSSLFGSGLTSSGNTSEARIMINGTAPSTNTVACNTSSIYNAGWFVSCTAVVSLAAGATIFASVLQVSGSTAQLATGFGASHLAAVFLSK